MLAGAGEAIGGATVPAPSEWFRQGHAADGALGRVQEFALTIDRHVRSSAAT
jgi:hypothetical protein